MKKQYRVVSLLLSALLIVGAASGCGGRTEAESSAPALPGTESVVSTAAGASGSEGTGIHSCRPRPMPAAMLSPRHRTLQPQKIMRGTKAGKQPLPPKQQPRRCRSRTRTRSI